MDYGYIQDVEVDSDDEDEDEDGDGDAAGASGQGALFPSGGVPSDIPSAAVGGEMLGDVAQTQQGNAEVGTGGGEEVAEETMEPESPTAARAAPPAASVMDGNRASDSQQMRFAPKRMFMDEVSRSVG